MKTGDWIAAAFILFMSLVASALTVRDKLAAKAGDRRIPERTLMLIGACFGSFAMFATMLIIRHKTKHAKFMLGLPVLMILDGALIAVWIAFLR
ncbi:MAG: DUF1294 domain-containing protein [Clostridia bacterium]|nr:DUF1294 domain-containing protein [Clostridia bacterium]